MFEHGVGGYNNHSCRCGLCRSAKAEYMRWWRIHKMSDSQRKVDARRNLAKSHALREGVPHGTLSGYTNHACRCWECTEAGSSYARVRAGGTKPKNKTLKYGTKHSTGNGIAALQEEMVRRNELR